MYHREMISLFLKAAVERNKQVRSWIVVKTDFRVYSRMFSNFFLPGNLAADLLSFLNQQGKSANHGDSVDGNCNRAAGQTSLCLLCALKSGQCSNSNKEDVFCWPPYWYSDSTFLALTHNLLILGLLFVPQMTSLKMTV